jgi:hypothetical protein
MFNFLRVNAANDALKANADDLLIVGGFPPKLAIYQITIEYGPREQREHNSDQQNNIAGEQRNATDRYARLQGLIHERR